MVSYFEFVDSKCFAQSLDEAFKKKFHLHWISLVSSMIEQYMCILFYFSVFFRERLDKNRMEFIKNLSSYNLMNFLYLNGSINKKLLNKIASFQSKRNKIVHGFILGHEKLSGIDLKNYFQLGKETTEELIQVILDYGKVRSVTEELFIELKNKFDRNQKKRSKYKTL